MSPLDPLLHLLFAGMGQAFVELGRFDEAIVAGKKALRQNFSFSQAYRCLVAAFAHLGRDAEAREAAARVLEVDPTFTISAWLARGGASKSEAVDRRLPQSRAARMSTVRSCRRGNRRTAFGTFETCPPILRMSVHRVDRKSPWSGQSDATRNGLARGPKARKRLPDPRARAKAEQWQDRRYGRVLSNTGMQRHFDRNSVYPSSSSSNFERVRQECRDQQFNHCKRLKPET
jgi:tetratricopeptide (TPR) repeat protein